MGARRGRDRSSLVAKPDLVSTTLIYPVRLTTDGTADSAGLVLTGAASGGVSQQVIEFKTSGGTSRVGCGIVGGFYTLARDIRAYNSAGTAYVGMIGRSDPGYLLLPDGTSAQGSRVFGGNGAPSSTTVGTASAGDYYFRRDPWSAPTLVAASQSTTTGTPITVGTGTLNANSTKLLDGTPAAGDLLIFVVENTESSCTATIGGDAAITATGTDGGVTANDGTRYVRMFSHVVQSGDISGGQITCTPSAHGSGSGRRLSAWVFRHAAGFATTGSLHGCPIVGSDDDIVASATYTLTSSAAATKHAVAVAANYASSAVTTTYYWDAGNASSKVNDMPGSGSSNASVGVKPGLGTNTSGAAGYAAGGTPTVDLAAANTTHVGLLGVWQAQSFAIASNSTLYVCTAGGSPGTWSGIL